MLRGENPLILNTIMAGSNEDSVENLCIQIMDSGDSGTDLRSVIRVHPFLA